MQFSKFRVQAPLLRYSSCVVSQFFIVRQRACTWSFVLIIWLLVRQKGFGYVLSLETPLHSNTEGSLQH